GTGWIGGGGSSATGGIVVGCSAAFAGAAAGAVAVDAVVAGATGVFGGGVVNTGSSAFSVSVSTNVVRSPGDGRVSVVDSGGVSPSTGGGLIEIVAIRYLVVTSSRFGGRRAPAATVAAKTSIRSRATVPGPF